MNDGETRTARIERTIEVLPTVEELAEQFCDLGSDEQCAFFAEVARIASSWRDGLGAQSQWCYIANGLRQDGDDRTKDFFLDIAAFLEAETS